ncbi:elongation factor 4 [Candidatus Microgenomates bacterium]|nr:elongation factor 4 [Candidatus Microgenomates bacterium CPR3]RIK51990.1 MAG: elongation factor 4 [Candidatus Microgenomates bacterium]
MTTTSHIRNFCIIAHIDHGKTTLTDRLLEETGTVAVGGSARLMDSNPIEIERGITIKLAPVRMNYTPNGFTDSRIHDNSYQLNLIDTPGHVDFSYEVSRALYACEGAVLVVDATKGIQAQTLANYDKAKAAGLTIIPVLNKIDMPAAEPDRVEAELVENLGFKKEEILRVSAKSGEGVPKLLEEIVCKIPAPKTDLRLNGSTDLRAFIFNSTFDTHKGVIAFVKVLEGEINKSNRENLYLYATEEKFSPLDIGYFAPLMKSADTIKAGEVGFIATGHKDIKAITIGDTVTTFGAKITPVPGYQKPQPMVFMDLYPIDADDYRDFVDAMGKLTLSDSALTYHVASSPALGHGFRVGFLGILHAEIVTERLSREFEVSVVNTSPSVPYHMTLKNGEKIEVSSPADWPRPEIIDAVEEPVVEMTIYTPEQYVGGIMELTQNKRAEFIDMQYVSSRVKLSYLMPLAELITNFYDRLKSVSSGYASVSYEHAGYQTIDVVKVDILLNGEAAEALSFIAPRYQAEGRGRVLVEKLKDVIPRAQIEIAIQAAIGGKIIARSTIRAYRKDVEAKLHGGDISRNKKLLDKQKRGKKKMKMLGRVEVPQSAFTEVLKIVS